MERPVLIGYGNEDERRMNNFLKQLGAVKDERLRKLQEKRAEKLQKHQKSVEEERLRQEAKAKASRKRVYKLQGIEKERAAKKRKFSNSAKDD